MYCQTCKCNIDREGTFCPQCGSVLQQKASLGGRLVYTKQSSSEEKTGNAESGMVMAEPVGSAVATYPDESLYYQEQFLKIEQNNGKRTALFYWVSLLLGPFWYIYKGIWVKGGILLGVGFFTGGILIPFLSLYTGFYGIYDYYLYKVKKQQL